MSNSFGFENSASWGSAGIALGLGIIEGQQREQRHREIVHAIQNSGRVNNMATDIALMRAEHQLKDKDALVDQLQRQIAEYRQRDADRVQSISKLNAAQEASVDAMQRLIDRQQKIIDGQAKLIASKDDLLQLQQRRIELKDEAILRADKQHAALKSENGELEFQVKICLGRIERFKKLCGW